MNRRISIAESKLGYLLVIPSLVVVIAMAFYPTATSFWMSLRKMSLIFRTNEFIGFSNFVQMAHDPEFWNALGNTFYFTFTSVALETIIGLGMALVINESFKGRGIVRASVLVPWAIPTVVTSTMWSWIFNSDYGLFNFILKRLHLIGDYQNWLGDVRLAINCAILADVWKTTPFIALILLAGLQTIPYELYEAALIDGAGGWRRFRFITLPLLLPIMLVAVLLRTLDAFRVFALIFVLTGGGPASSTEVLSTYAYKVLFSTSNFGYGSALAVSMFICVLIISFFFLLALSRQIKVRG
jgi:multiple sugar transport system permease protein